MNIADWPVAELNQSIQSFLDSVQDGFSARLQEEILSPFRETLERVALSDDVNAPFVQKMNERMQNLTRPEISGE